MRQLVLSILLWCIPAANADVFDRYTNPILATAPGAEGVKEIPKLTPQLIAEHGNLLPNVDGVLLMVKTNGGLNSKVVVQMARQRRGADSVPIALIERFVSFKASQDRAVQAAGQNIHLYGGFHYNLDIGQVVPADVGADLRFTAGGDQCVLEPVGKAKLYLITKPLPGTEPKKTGNPAVGDVFDVQYFTGTYQLHDDGRRFAKLTLKVDAEGQVTGEYISDKTGQKYEVTGKAGNPKHLVLFEVKFPQTKQAFQGWLFTRDARVLCGFTRLQEHEFGFYAVRVEEE